MQSAKLSLALRILRGCQLVSILISACLSAALCGEDDGGLLYGLMLLFAILGLLTSIAIPVLDHKWPQKRRVRLGLHVFEILLSLVYLTAAVGLLIIYQDFACNVFAAVLGPFCGSWAALATFFLIAFVTTIAIAVMDPMTKKAKVGEASVRMQALRTGDQA